MCRILGAAFGPEREDLDAGEIAAVLFPNLTNGGPHAYGWMSFDEASEEIVHEKFVGRADTKKAEKNIFADLDPKAKWFVGHTRFATHGSPSDLRNDHPIPHGNIIGVHNGVLRNHEKILAVTGREDPKTLVDSEAIFAAVNKWGPTKGLGKIDGDLVSLYADRRKPHVLHIARTHGRQLTIGWTERGNLIFASEQQALDKLAPEIKFVKFSTISENRLLIVRNGKIIQRHRFAPVTRVAPERRQVPVWTPPRGSVRVSTATLDQELAAIRAERRGKLLFPPKLDVPECPTRKAKKGKNRKSTPVYEPLTIETADGKPPPKRKPNQNQKLYYWEGQLYTREEYEEAIASK